MPAGFTERERERITEQLLATGYRLFTTQGLRKTSLDELVAPAGIAKSSFYAFFDSKEALFLELMMRQAPQVTEALPEVLRGGGTARERLRTALLTGVEVATGNPLYQRLLRHPDEAAAVIRRVGPAEMERARPYVVTPLLEFITEAQETGEMVKADPMVVLGVIQAASLISLHVDEFGDQYDDVLELLMRSVAFGLTVPDPPAGDGNQPSTDDKSIRSDHESDPGARGPRGQRHQEQ